MILKHRDTEVLRFDWVKPFGVTNVELNRSAERFLPLAYRDRVIGKDEMIDRIKGLEKFEFKPHPEFVMPHNRLEMTLHLLQNRIAKIVKYGAKADRYLKIRAKNDTVNPTIPDKLLKNGQTPEDLRKELKATLKSFPRAKTDRLAVLFKVSVSTIKRHIKALQDAGELKRVGSDKNVLWQVIEKEAKQ